MPVAEQAAFRSALFREGLPAAAWRLSLATRVACAGARRPDAVRSDTSGSWREAWASEAACERVLLAGQVFDWQHQRLLERVRSNR